METASLILGVLGMLFSCVGIGIVPSIVGFVLGIMSYKKKDSSKKSAGIVGLVTSSVGLMVGSFAIIVILFGEVRPSEGQPSSTYYAEESQETTTESVETEAETETEKKEEIEEVKQTEKESKAEIVLSKDEQLLVDLTELLGNDVGNKAYDIMLNQIGFSNVEYEGKNSMGNTNYDFVSEYYDFTMTASDDVYRIFQPNGGVVFYEDGEVKTTVADLESKRIDHYDRTAYYIIAQMMVEEGLKNPGSAKFPSIVTRPEEIGMSKNDDIVGVQSYVDAQNSYGAMVRSSWTVEFRVLNLASYSYEPLFLSIDGKVLYGEFIDLD